MKTFWIFLLCSAVFIPNVMGCTLPKGEKLVIGCGYKCDFLYKLRLKTSARYLGYPIEVVSMPEQGLENSLSRVDGILIPGGADIDPKYYTDKITPELREYTLKNLNLVKWSKEGAERDPFESALMSRYNTDEKFKKLPLLGICRGMQMMTVSQGIPLYLDIKTETGIKNRHYVFDRIFFEQSDNVISSLYINESVKGFEIHHQGLRVPYWNDHKNEFPNVKVTAYSNNGIVAEAIEFQNRPAIGVQYHPEKSTTSTAAPILKWLLTKSCEYKNSKEIQ